MSTLFLRVGRTLVVAVQAIGMVTASMPSVALGQSTVTDDPPILPTYHVEVLILRHTDQSRTTDEVRPAPDPGLPTDFDIDGLDEAPDAEMQRDMANARLAPVAPPANHHASDPVRFLLLEPVSTPPDFVQLLPEQFKLTEVWDKLDEIDAYEPVLHIAWLQPARGEAEAVPYDLVVTDADPDVVTGNLTLYKQRFLHFEVDLTMRQADDAEDTSAGGFWGRFTFDLDNEDVTYRMHQSRRIRGDSLHYFDHPKFGVIVAIAELVIEEEEDEAAETTASAQFNSG